MSDDSVLETSTRSTGLPPPYPVAGVDVGYFGIRSGISDGAGLLVEQSVHTHEDEWIDNLSEEEVLSLVADSLASSCRDAEVHPSDIKAVGVALPAPIDARTGHLLSDAILKNWSPNVNSSIQLFLERHLGVRAKVLVGNDANVCALGEAATGGVAESIDDFVFIKASGGVGAGLWLAGRLYVGAKGAAGELGHILVDPDSPQFCDRCRQRGCLESVASTSAIVERVRRDIKYGETITSREVIARATLPDHPSCRRAVTEAAIYIGLAAASLVTVLDLDVVVLGGALSRAGSVAVDAMQHAINRRSMAIRNRTPLVKRVIDPDLTGIRGAIELAKSHDLRLV